jgi:pimeloyl-ACP methyl ester carboxylesterase
MNKKILCLNGWGQEPKTLENAFKEVFKDDDISTIDYLDTYDVVIGWSYGSQLAIKKIEAGFLRTKLLILIAPIFQFVENKTNKVGMPKEMFDYFLVAFKNSPEGTMRQLIKMSASCDKNADLVFDKMKIQDLNVLSNYALEQQLLQLGVESLSLARRVLSNYALEQQLLHLKDFSCFDVNFKKFPKTICFSGANDAVVASSQAKLFAERIKDFELHIIENCGHAPHFSHMEKIEKVLKNFI